MGHGEIPKQLDFVQALGNRDPRILTALAVTEKLFYEIRPDETNIIEAVNFANELQRQIATVLRVEDLSKLREVSIGKTSFLASTLRSPGGKVILIRHGAQHVADEVKTLPPVSQKIRMMQIPNNMDDPLTSSSIAESAGTAYMLRFLSGQTKKPIIIKSSENLRSAEVAAMVARITNAPVTYDKRLNCINYPNSLSDDEITGLLGSENNGALLWKDEAVDAISGKGTFGKITTDVSSLISEGLQSRVINLFVTHTQQTNASDALCHEKPIRWAELGMRVFSGQQNSLLLQNGVYAY